MKKYLKAIALRGLGAATLFLCVVASPLSAPAWATDCSVTGQQASILAQVFANGTNRIGASNIQSALAVIYNCVPNNTTGVPTSQLTGTISNALLGSGVAAANLGFVPLSPANNLSELANVTTARTNLGLGTAATQASSAFLQGSNNFSDVANIVTARANLGLGSAATQPATAFLQGSNNLSDIASASSARTNLGLGSAATQASSAFLQGSNNLSDVGSASTARTNLGLGTAATQASSAFLQGSNNLSDVGNAATARTNLGAVNKAGDTMTGSLTVGNGSGSVGVTINGSTGSAPQFGFERNSSSSSGGAIGTNGTFDVYVQDNASGALILGCGGTLGPGNCEAGEAGKTTSTVGTWSTTTQGLADASTDVASDQFVANATGNNITYVTPGYCAVANLTGNIDNTACIQSAINAACGLATGPGELVFGAYAYYIKTHTNILKSCPGLRISGTNDIGQTVNLATSTTTLGQGGTRIYRDANCDGPAFNFYSDATSNYVYGGAVEHIAFLETNPSSICTSYPMIQFNFAQHVEMFDLYAWQPGPFIKLVSGLHLNMDHIYLDQVWEDINAFEFVGTGATANATGQQTRQDAIMLSHTFAGASGTLNGGHHPFTMIRWHEFSNTLSLRTVAAENVGSFLWSDCAGGGATDESACPSFLNAFDIQAEGGGGLGNGDLIWTVDTSAIYITQGYMHCLTSWAGGCNNAAGFENSAWHGAQDVQLVGGQYDSSNASCIWSEVQGFSLTGGTRVFGCGQTGAGSHGVDLVTPFTSDVSGSDIIVGNKFCVAGSGGAGTNFQYAVDIQSSVDFVVVANNSFQGCQNGIANGSSGTHITTTPNVGP